MHQYKSSDKAHRLIRELGLTFATGSYQLARGEHLCHPPDRAQCQGVVEK